MSLSISKPTHPLSALMPLLKHVGFLLSAIPADEQPEHPYVRLLVSESETSGPVELVLLNDIAAASAKQARLPLDPGVFGLLRFILRHPLGLSPEQTLVAPLVLMTANRSLATGSWNLNPQDGVFLEYTLLFPPEQPLSGALIVELIEKLFQAQASQGELLARWATGQASLLQTLASLQTNPQEVQL